MSTDFNSNTRQTALSGWIVDGDARQVEVWTPEDVFPRLERDRLTWQPEGTGAPFTLSLQELFRAIE